MEQQLLLDLIQRSRAGDRQAQEKLVGEAQNRVYYHCKKMLKNDEDALDATQDVLITMLTSLDKLREPAVFWGWVNGITANRCKHLLTQGTKEWQIPEDEEGNSLLDDVEDLDDQVAPEKAIDNAETQRLITEIIDSLPPEQKMSVLFFYYDEMSVKEIAAAMEVSEGTVKSRLNYARKSIKDGVERLAKQGTKLYGISPLPFLAYFLRMGAQSQVLSPAAAAALTQGTLASAGAVGAAAGTATGATAVAGSAGSAGASAAAGTAGAAAKGIISSKLALGLAGVAVAGTVAGGVALSSRQATPEPTPAPIPTAVMAVATPAPTPEPEETLTPEETPEPTPEPPATPEPSEVPEETPEPTPASEDFVIENGVLVKYNGPGGDVVVPEGVREIGEHPFSGARRSLTGVVLPEGVTGIGKDAFLMCEGLKTVSFPASLKTIGAFAFSGCKELRDLVLPAGLTTIGDHAFYRCGALDAISIPEHVTTIGEYAFASTGLSSIMIPDNVTSMGGGTFSRCENLSSVSLGKGLTQIESTTFYACPSLTEITIPENISHMSSNVFFDGTVNLTTVTILNPAVTFDSTFFKAGTINPKLTLYASSGSTAETYAKNNGIPFVALDAPEPTPTPEPEEFVIKDGALIEYNGPGGRVVVPDGVTVIGNETLYDSGVFDDRSDITEVILPSSVTTITRYCFANSGLTSITIPESVITIYGVAFDGCENLTDVYFLSSSTGFDGRMGSDGYLDPFQNCPNLTIHAPAGSIAEAFAQSYNIPFEPT